jgi:hypothetical protein
VLELRKCWVHGAVVPLTLSSFAWWASVLCCLVSCGESGSLIGTRSTERASDPLRLTLLYADGPMQVPSDRSWQSVDCRVDCRVVRGGGWARMLDGQRREVVALPNICLSEGAVTRIPLLS